MAMTAALLLAAAAAAADAAPDQPAIDVPSGAEVWLQETMTDRVPGMGLIQRYRFVMPALEELVPPVPDAMLDANLPPADMLDAPYEGDMPLTADEQAEIDAALGGLVITPVPAGDAAPGLPDDAAGGTGSGAPLPSELAPPDAALPDGTIPDSAAPEPPLADLEEGDDLAAIEGGGGPVGGAGAQAADGQMPGDLPLPAAPDALMQDPLHRDIVYLCENFALPRIAHMSPRPTQVVISMASAPSPFGSFDPGIVQLFEGFSIPRDRDACLWEPM